MYFGNKHYIDYTYTCLLGIYASTGGFTQVYGVRENKLDVDVKPLGVNHIIMGFDTGGGPHFV